MLSESKNKKPSVLANSFTWSPVKTVPWSAVMIFGMPNLWLSFQMLITTSWFTFLNGMTFLSGCPRKKGKESSEGAFYIFLAFICKTRTHVPHPLRLAQSSHSSLDSSYLITSYRKIGSNYEVSRAYVLRSRYFAPCRIEGFFLLFLAISGRIWTYDQKHQQPTALPLSYWEGLKTFGLQIYTNLISSALEMSTSLIQSK